MLPESRRGASHDEAAIAGIPARFSWATVDAAALAHRVQSTKSVEALVRPSWRLHGSLLVGLRGRGKHRSLWRAFARCCHMRFMVSPGRLAQAPIEHSAGRGEAPLVLCAKAARDAAPCDLGTDKITKVSAVRDVVFARYDAGLPTWISTGISSVRLSRSMAAGSRVVQCQALTIGLGVKG